MSAESYWAVVPAAGIGARMQSPALANIPKQYLPLRGKTIIEHSLSRLLAIPAIKKVVLSLHLEDTHWANLPLAQNTKFQLTDGGKERCDSVLNGLRALAPLAKESDWVLVHDAARPCVSVAAIQQLMDAVQAHPIGGILAVPVSDTLKRGEGEWITATVDRASLWQAHTPQLFRFGLLKQSLELALAEGFQVTDEASALEFAGHQPLLVEDRRDNIKITRPEDLAMAEAILAYQAQQGELIE